MLLHSPAKINIGLKVLGKRFSDGYHNIFSIFVPISFGDFIEVKEGLRDQLVCENRIALEDGRSAFDELIKENKQENNLIWHVLKKTKPFREKSFFIKLIKHIPLGSGLGGGSSNAGVLLSYFYKQKLLGSDFSKKQLLKIAIELGADVPFFLEPAPSVIYSIGEKRKKLKIAQGLGVLILTGLHINTRQAFELLKRGLHLSPFKNFLYSANRVLQNTLKQGNWGRLGLHLQNDFEKVIFPLYSELESLSNELSKEDVLYVQMSGSGSALFALVASENSQRKICEIFQTAYPKFQIVPFTFEGSF